MAWSGPPRTVIGSRPPSDSNRAPIRLSGSMTRRIGRRRSESSPVSVVEKGRPARRPASNRAVVPELPASSGPSGELNPPAPRPLTVMASPERENCPPRPSRHESVDRQSAPGANPRITDRPAAIAARIAYRWAIDLSPGTCSEPVMARDGEDADGTRQDHGRTIASRGPGWTVFRGCVTLCEPVVAG